MGLLGWRVIVRVKISQAGSCVEFIQVIVHRWAGCLFNPVSGEDHYAYNLKTPMIVALPTTDISQLTAQLRLK